MGGIYFYNDWRARTDVGSRPDYGRPEVREFIRDNVMMWLQEYRIDGLRFDKVAGIRNAHSRDDVAWDDPSNLDGWGWNLMRWINDEVDHQQLWKIMIAEDMRQNSKITAPTSSGGAGFDSQWDDQFYKAIRAAMETPDDNQRNLYAVRDAITRRWNDNAFHRVIYTESHDEVGSFDGSPNGKSRLPKAISPGQADGYFAKKRSTLGAAIVMTSPGIPLLFQGQEMLEWSLFDGKQPLDWSKASRYSGIMSLYRDLIRLRRNWFNQTRGLQGHETNVFHINQSFGVLAMHRYDRGGPGDDTIVVFNFHNKAYSDYRIGFPRDGRWHVRFNSDWSGYSHDFQNHSSFDTYAHRGDYDDLHSNGTIGIGAYSAIILSQSS
jgi:1,4-alpha-glucan branching enzyme